MTVAADAVVGAGAAYSVKAHRLTDNGQPVPFRQSPHGGARLKPLYLVVHYTAGLSAGSAVDWFLDPRAKASAHLVIDRRGAATQLMSFDRTCWHAGKSAWKGLEGLNGHSIGIEIVNAGKLSKGPGGRWQTWTGETIPDAEVVVARHRDEQCEAGWHAYAPDQIAAVTAIGVALHSAYGFRGVLGHEDIAPGRKVDPGPAFPLESVAARILGRA
jgi:N-acetylmuramoyl-L-alanine amidase